VYHSLGQQRNDDTIVVVELQLQQCV
jgi:hypothetical protein